MRELPHTRGSDGVSDFLVSFGTSIKEIKYISSNSEIVFDNKFRDDIDKLISSVFTEADGWSGLTDFGDNGGYFTVSHFAPKKSKKK